MTTLNFLQFLQDGQGVFSSTRLAFLLWAIGVLAVWMIESLHAGNLAHIDESVIIVLSALMTNKVIQKFAEKSETPSAEGVQPKIAPVVKTGSAGVVPVSATT